MRIERQDEVEKLLEETLKAAKAAQKAAESANGYLFWMNVGWYVRMAFTAAIVIGLALFGWHVTRELKRIGTAMAQQAQQMTLPANIPITFPTP